MIFVSVLIGLLVFFADSFSIHSGTSTTILEPFLVSSARSLSDLDFLTQWKSSLQRGCTPDPDDILAQRISEKVFELQLPRLVQRHPAICSSVLLYILRAKHEYERRMVQEVDDGDGIAALVEPSLQDDDSDTVESEMLSSINNVVDDIVEGIFEDLDEASATAPLLEQINPELVSQFGLQDGVWEHTGWQVVPSLLRELERHKDLRKLFARLGKRPSSIESSRNQVLCEHKRSRTGSQNPIRDNEQISSISGLKLSGNLHEMLPTEAVLLKGSPTLRKLFLSKLVDDKLWSYQMIGYEDFPNTQKTTKQSRQPMESSGPIIVCLDTSDSMSSFQREQLSKTIVLATVMTAMKQHRVCRIVAFAHTGNLISPDDIRNDKAGIAQLLDFLSYRFVSGGTDITGALRYAVEQLEDYANADVLLVTDGEIPYVTDENLLEKLKLRTVEVHGLSVGSQKSDSLDQICTETHDFLMPRGSVIEHHGWGRLVASQRYSTRLLARRRRFDDWDDEGVVATPRKVSTTPIAKAETEEYEKEVAMNLEKLITLARQKADETMNLPPSLLPAKMRSSLDLAISSMSLNLLERDEEARLVVLAFLSGEHILFIGPPGVAKSQLGRRLSTLCGQSFFQRLLTRFTTPEELFGPLSLQALEKDVYRRQTHGYLPTASIAFLDEIFKANSAILNTLLSILNERKFDNGGIREECPVKCVIAASNELPENDELEALYDRFLLRKEVKALSDDGLVAALLVTSRETVDTLSNESLVLDDVMHHIETMLHSVELPPQAAVLIKDLRTYLRDILDVDVSDRRLIQAARLLRISALTNGRLRVEPIDCMVLQHIVWKNPDHHNHVYEWLQENIAPGRDVWQIGSILDTIREEAIIAVRKTAGDCSGRNGARKMDVERISSIREETSQIAITLRREKDGLDAHLGLLSSLESHVWLCREQTQSLKQPLTLQAQQRLSNVQLLLHNAYLLEEALSPTAVSDITRLAVISSLWSEDSKVQFTDEELTLSMREAKAKFNDELFRRWKRQRKRGRDGND